MVNEFITHRIGRTARAEKRGEAISLVATDEEKQFFKQILFNYNSNIKLKTVGVSDLPRTIEVPVQNMHISRHHTQTQEKYRHRSGSHIRR